MTNKTAQITIETIYEVSVPDDVLDKVRQYQRELDGASEDQLLSDEDILTHIAVVAGVRGISHVEIMYPEDMARVSVTQISDDEVIDFEWQN